jgi:lactam utilization protein B
LPEHLEKWHTVYPRMNRWAEEGVLEELQKKQIVSIQLDAVSIDSTSIKVHPDGTGALKRADRNRSESPKVDGRQKFTLLRQVRIWP